MPPPTNPLSEDLDANGFRTRNAAASAADNDYVRRGELVGLILAAAIQAQFLRRDGVNSATNDIPFTPTNTKTITGIRDGAAPHEPATKGQLDGVSATLTALINAAANLRPTFPFNRLVLPGGTGVTTWTNPFSFDVYVYALACGAGGGGGGQGNGPTIGQRDGGAGGRGARLQIRLPVAVGESITGIVVGTGGGKGGPGASGDQRCGGGGGGGGGTRFIHRGTTYYAGGGGGGGGGGDDNLPSHNGGDATVAGEAGNGTGGAAGSGVSNLGGAGGVNPNTNTVGVAGSDGIASAATDPILDPLFHQITAGTPGVGGVQTVSNATNDNATAGDSGILIFQW